MINSELSSILSIVKKAKTLEGLEYELTKINEEYGNLAERFKLGETEKPVKEVRRDIRATFETKEPVQLTATEYRQKVKQKLAEKQIVQSPKN